MRLSRYARRTRHGLGTRRLRRHALPTIMTRARYFLHRGLDRYCAQLTRHGGRAAERDVEHDDLIPPNWHAGLIPLPKNFPLECSLKLTHREAEYLQANPFEPGLLSLTACGACRVAATQRRYSTNSVCWSWALPLISYSPITVLRSNRCSKKFL